ncbi:hypothetical protein NKH18_07100 [Streptomyces sp. M10(2022)]
MTRDKMMTRRGMRRYNCCPGHNPAPTTTDVNASARTANGGRTSDLIFAQRTGPVPAALTCRRVGLPRTRPSLPILEAFRAPPPDRRPCAPSAPGA